MIDIETKEGKLMRKYLTKYTSTHVVKRGEDLVYVIPCKNGTIQPYMVPDGKSITHLSYCHLGGTKRQKGALLKKLKPYNGELVQEGDTEFVLKFPEYRLARIAPIVHAKKRRQYSEETLARLRQNATLLGKKGVSSGTAPL